MMNASPSRRAARLSEEVSGTGCLTYAASPRRAARGITLLEVLISTFVLSIGLLGVAALIPVGRRQIERGSQYERAATCGRSTIRELYARGYFDPGTWLNFQGLTYDSAAVAGTFPFPYPYTDPSAWPDGDELGSQYLESPIAKGNSVCIDPLYFANGIRNDVVDARMINAQWFPQPVAGDDPNGGGTFPNPPRMQRATVRGAQSLAAGLLGVSPAPNAAGFYFSPAQARRLCTWQDEVLFDLPADETRRPELSTVIDSTKTAMQQRSVGEYSWLVTLTPQPVESGSLTPGEQNLTASLVVFHRRDLNWALRGELSLVPGARPAPKERIVYCEMVGGGLGGGAVRLVLPVLAGGQNNNPARPDRSDMPTVRAGQWMMLCGWRQPDLTVAASPPERHAVFRWYRVAAAADAPVFDSTIGTNGGWYQDATLIGADWNVKGNEFLDADQAGVATTCYAALIDGVVGVYETTVKHVQ